MKQNNRLSISLSILIFWTGLLIGGEPFAGLRGRRRRAPREIKYYYEPIGIEGFDKIFAAANRDADIKGAEKRRAIEKLQATIEELEEKFPEAKDKKALEEQIYGINVELRKACIKRNTRVDAWMIPKMAPDVVISAHDDLMDRFIFEMLRTVGHHAGKIRV